jgi:eukaryotic-like serine/threonine-protein kinase
MTDIATRLADALKGRYEIDRELGHGGMATVHLARDVRHGRQVAIKVLRPELAQNLGGDRFLREINIAAKLQSPHILPLLDSGEADGLLFYVMPYVVGDSLRGMITRQGALAPSEAMRLLRDIVDGLAHAHRNGVVHRDMKPDNVMIADRHALVVDFGVAKAMKDASAHHDLTSIGISLGTPTYMAPEQAAADPNIDHRADLYAVGVMAYEMLTGKPPFTGTPQAVMAAHITQTPVPLLQVKPDVPPAIAQIVMQLLEKDPANRYANADELLTAIENLTTPTGAYAPSAAKPSTPKRVGLVLGVLAAAIAIYFGSASIRQDRWVHRDALPELKRLVEAGEIDSAFAVAMEIAAVVPDDSTLRTLYPQFARKRVLRVNVDGVRISRASLNDTTQWFDVGISPLDTVLVPARPNLFRYEKEGYVTLYRLAPHPFLGFYADTGAVLRAPGDPDPEMVRIGGGKLRSFLVGADFAEPVEAAGYLMDEYETTNAEYQKFVDAGGYGDAQWWEHPIVDGARTLSFAEAMARFVDATGRPGPAAWQGGTFPAGREAYPVSGVSWYEAAAYAKFRGKSLPTIYHWANAATIVFSRFMVAGSVLDTEGPQPVGTPRAVGGTGVSDMGGNVREWVYNDAGRGQRYILGGGWSDQTYGLVDAYAQPPIDRSPINGIRLAKYAEGETNLARAQAPLLRAFRDFQQERPVNDALFAAYRPMYDYDPGALTPTVEKAETTSVWIKEFVSFNAAYGRERMMAWLYRPAGASTPVQTIVIFPGSGSINGGRSENMYSAFAEWIVRSGRAFVFPIYKSTHERADSLRSDYANETIFYRDHVVMWAKDYRRTLDYLETRPEFDSSKIGYFGLSWGGFFGGLVPAVEPRIKASVLYVAGLGMERARPEADVLNFLPRVKQPTLMLNGRQDFFFPVETAQEPFFRYLGTPAADKAYKVYEGGHDVPRTELIKETLGWFDRYLGPVR